MSTLPPRPSSPATLPGEQKRPNERFNRQFGLLVIVLVSIGVASLYLGARVMGALPDVGKNLNIRESWGAPIAVERREDGWIVAHIPPCAQGPIAGLFLWGEDNEPFWQLEGEAFPIDSFLVGGTPPGLKVVEKLKEPSSDQVLRLGVFRANGRPAGVTFRIKDLRSGEVRYRGRWLTVNEFRASAKCPKSAPQPDKSSTSTSTSGPATLPAQTLPPPPTTFPSTSVP